METSYQFLLSYFSRLAVLFLSFIYLSDLSCADLGDYDQENFDKQNTGDRSALLQLQSPSEYPSSSRYDGLGSSFSSREMPTDAQQELLARSISPASGGSGGYGYGYGYGDGVGLGFTNGYNGGRFPLPGVGLGRGPFREQIGRMMGGFGHFARPYFFPWFPFINPYVGINYVGRIDRYRGNYAVYNGDYDGYIQPTTPAPTTTTTYNYNATFNPLAYFGSQKVAPGYYFQGELYGK